LNERRGRVKRARSSPRKGWFHAGEVAGAGDLREV